MKCIYCGTENSDNSRFCTNCGRELPYSNEVKVCKKCGASNNKEFNYCTKCGSKLDDEEVNDANNQSGIVEYKKCSKCGYENKLSNNYCVKCGSALDEAIIIPKYEATIEVQVQSSPVVKKPHYIHYRYTVTTMILTFAFIMLPIFGQIASIIMSIIALAFAIQDKRNGGSIETNECIGISICMLVLSIALCVIYSVAIAAFVEFVEDFLEDPETINNGAVYATYIKQIFLRV